jgi:hypothetical protein
MMVMMHNVNLITVVSPHGFPVGLMDLFPRENMLVSND